MVPFAVFKVYMVVCIAEDISVDVICVVLMLKVPFTTLGLAETPQSDCVYSDTEVCDCSPN